MVLLEITLAFPRRTKGSSYKPKEEIHYDQGDFVIKSHFRIIDRLFYGWVVVIASFIIITIVLGVRFSFGVFFKPLSSEFGLNRAGTSGIFSTYMLLCIIFNILGGWFVDKFGPRIIASIMGLFTGLSLLLTGQANSLWQLLVFYSLFSAIGTGGAYVVSMSIITRWFDKKRGLAIGISTSGVGLGMVIIAPIATYFITKFGWRTSCILIGIISSFFIVSMAMLLKKEPAEMGLFPDGVESNGGKTVLPDIKEVHKQPFSFSLLQAFQTRSFWCIGLSWLLFSSCFHTVLTHIVPHSTDMGISEMKAAAILSLIGATSIPGRLLIGRVSDNIGRRVTAIICALLATGAIIWLIWSQKLWMFYFFAMVFGFSYGGIDTSIVALVGDIFGLRSIGIIFGILSIGWLLGAAIGPAIGGWTYDFSNNYSIAFSTDVIAMLIVTLLLALTKRETNPEK
jgi:OFA family oxalate/formate antiporter-like MFS transporter